MCCGTNICGGECLICYLCSEEELVLRCKIGRKYK